ncbi:MAG: hypothetical protein JRJ80_20795 [Deltaproteobacteria bacterium]|nr:hypothetical protein [Deltaproteobacteria bacterium]
MATPFANARGLLATLLATLALGMLAYFAWPCSQETAPTPDVPRLVLLLSIDTLRDDRVGPHGDGPSATPQLDKLATTRCLRMARC